MSNLPSPTGDTGELRQRLSSFKLGDDSPLNDSEIEELLQLIARTTQLAAIEARINEIEDISQSRDVQQTAAGKYYCNSCNQNLARKDSVCACEILYRNRAKRLVELQAARDALEKQG